MTTYVKKSETRDVVWRVFSYFSRGGVIPIDIDEATEGCIESMPTIEIVTCKECKYSHVYALDSNEKPQRWCKVGLAKAVNDDDYCSWGE